MQIFWHKLAHNMNLSKAFRSVLRSPVASLHQPFRSVGGARNRCLYGVGNQRFSAKPMGPMQSSIRRMSTEKVNPDGLTRYPSLSSPNGVLRLMDWIGTLSFASSGAITAGYYGMDMLGCIVVGTITSVGGGTIRDVLLGNAPVFWMLEWEYILMCIGASGLTFCFWDQVKEQEALKEDGWLLFWTDTIGVGAFCVIGAQNGIRRGMPALICILCGMFTATFGGMVRDVLCRRQPRILHSNAEIYATTALFGATAYVGARALGANPAVRIFSGVTSAMALRYLADRQNIKLPLAPWNKQ